MAHSEESWLTAKSMFEAGKSLTDIEKTTGISKGQISKKSKKEEWQKETLKDLAKREVHTTIVQKEIEKEKETLSATQMKHYNEVLLTEMQSGNLALNANHLLLQEIHKDLERGTKETKVNMGEGMQRLEPMQFEPSDRVHQAKAIQTVTDSLGITDRHAPKQDISLNAQQNNNMTKAEISQAVAESLPD